jgi:hypothetical protein
MRVVDLLSEALKQNRKTRRIRRNGVSNFRFDICRAVWMTAALAKEAYVGGIRAEGRYSFSRSFQSVLKELPGKRGEWISRTGGGERGGWDKVDVGIWHEKNFFL